VVHLGGDIGAVVEQDQLRGELADIAVAGLGDEGGEQLVQPDTEVFGGELFCAAGRGLGSGVDEGASPEIGLREQVTESVEYSEDLLHLDRRSGELGIDAGGPFGVPVLQVGAHEVIFAAEVVVERSFVDPGLLKNAVDPDGADAFLVEQAVGRLEQAFAGRPPARARGGKP
jgi:hypothetical protein